ncbi:DUF4167 domain-containing protein [Alphaproteobacteria bacterium LSUCC0684]
MRQPGKNNRQRGRGRRNGHGQINRNTTLDSNGPDVRLRGNALQLHEKYVSLGNDASAAGERIAAEAYYQYADHYFRIHSAIIASTEERRKDGAEMNGQANGHASPEARSMNGADSSEDDTAESTADETASAKPSKSVKAASPDEDQGDDADEAEAAS